ncbi:MAG: radical SAM protein, partial [Pseudomonadota bacterium]
VFRPPSEAESLILQVTLGCSHNLCTFCSMYTTKQFRVKTQEEIQKNIREAKHVAGSEVQRVFLADGDAMCLSTRRLLEILDQLNDSFPRLQRVGIYANARDVLKKTNKELEQLRERKLRILYIGLESGDEETLVRIEKGAKAEEIVEAVKRAQAARMKTSVMVLIGLAGRERSLVHGKSSAIAINRMEPTYTALLTYTPVPGSKLFEKIGRGEFELPSARESLLEIREFLANLSCRTYFTCNHASNYLPLTGILPEHKEDLLATLDAALRNEIPLKPEFLRGL